MRSPRSRAGRTTAARSSRCRRSTPNRRTAAAVMKSNLGMYRVQLGGGRYESGREAGLHYQIHRGIGVHHAMAVARDEPLKVSIFVGGPPAHTLAAVMPLPEGLTELLFAGMLNGRRFRLAHRDGYGISTEADVVITGTIDPAARNRKARSAITSATTASPTQFPVIDDSTSRLPSKGRGVAFHGRRSASPGRHDVRQADP